MAVWNLFDKIRRTPVATVPLVPLPPAPPGARGVPQVDPSRCHGCGRCVQGCPAGALAYAGRTWQLDLGRCHWCGVCVEVCPVQALTQGQVHAVAARDRRRLLVSVVTHGGE